MKQGDINQYKALLTAKLDEILGRSRRREDIWIVESNDLIESVQLASDRELAIRTLERESTSLMQVGAALKRIDHDEFGICLECDEPISIKRLAAVPWAAYCLECQQLHDKRDSTDAYERQLAA
ncbi:MAG: TraR/DksA family transcriptional regulator [Candidatus Sulfotelmatobacter sp.]